MKKQRLIDLKFDWTVSTDGGFTISMTDDDEFDNKLEFKAYFMRESILYEQSLNREITQEDLDYINSTFYRILKVTFTGGWCCFAPINNASEQMMREKFNWSGVFGLDENGDLLNQDTYLDEYKKKWLEDEICPDSSFYEVENSQWIKEVDSENKWKLKHYLIFGEQYYTEFLTQKLNWSD